MQTLPAVQLENATLPTVTSKGDDSPVRKINSQGLKGLAAELTKLFEQYRSDRKMQEERWLRNLRQYLGYYDPEVEKQLSTERSKAYPKITRTKCVSMLSRIMDLMFPSDDKNWTINARPSPDMAIKDVQEAIAKAQARDQAAGMQPQLDLDYVMGAVQDLATQRAKDLSVEVSDQLQELGGDQSYDYVAINNEVVASGILYGIGLARGPFIREVTTASWSMDAKNNVPVAKTVKHYMPLYERLSVWDFYPDFAAKRLDDTDGYFVRHVMSKNQVRKLADRTDFFKDVIKKYLSTHEIGNYVQQTFETELRGMGIKEAVNTQKTQSSKYEIIVWHGPVDGAWLRHAGIEVDDDKLSDQMDAEVWMLDGYVIKAVLNPWRELGTDVKSLHYFIFDLDDTAPVGFGLPNILRDTQMGISAATRMMMDNASVVCGPILEINTALMAQNGQDLSQLSAYKIFYRDDDGPSAQFPAVRDVKIESHINELQSIIDFYLKLADMETFVGPMTGGDQSKMPSEPMRNAAGASMMMGNAALPFKQIIRNFDLFTQSLIQSVVLFNRQLNPTKVKVAEFDVIARGATSLIAKEMRGMQVDQLVATLTPEEKLHVDTRKLVEARFAVRDLDNMLVSEAEAARRQTASDQAQQAITQLQQQAENATIRKLLSDAYKNIAQGQKNSAAAQAEAVSTALDIMERDAKNSLNDATKTNIHADTVAKLAGANHGAGQPDPAAGDDGSDPQAAGGGGAEDASGAGDGTVPPLDPGVAALMGGAGQGQNGGMPPVGLAGGAGAASSLQ